MKGLYKIFGFFIFIGLTTSSNLIAQKGVLGIPNEFKQPRDLSFNNRDYLDYLERTENKDKKIPWVVISDRDNNPLHISPGGAQVGVIGFKELFYVKEERDGWIELYKGNVEGLSTLDGKSIGWVPKTNMLLWTTGLVNDTTKIHKKAFILNKALNIKEVLQKSENEIELANIYSSPNKASRLKQIPLHDIYFVMKIDPDYKTILLCTNYEVSHSTAQDDIIGWVDSGEAEFWNTRVCLEPNFRPEAYAERRDNLKLQVKGFKDIESALLYSAGEFHDRNIYWSGDPVIMDKKYLAQSNPARFKGNIVRFPMLDYKSTNNASVYVSGVIGQTYYDGKGVQQFAGNAKSDIEYGEITNFIQGLQSRAEKVNLFFIIEATRLTSQFQPAIVEAISKVVKDLKGTDTRFGAILYRDIFDKPNLDPLKLTSDGNKVISFVKDKKFVSIDTDPYTTLYSAVNECIRFGGFNKNEAQNIIVIIGGNGDYRRDEARYALASQKKDATLFTNEKLVSLYEELSEFKAQIIGIQIMREKKVQSRAFNEQVHGLIEESAKFAYNKLQHDGNIMLFEQALADLNTPIIPDPEYDISYVAVSGGRILSSLSMPPVDRAFTAMEISDAIVREVNRSKDRERTIASTLYQVYGEGRSVDDVVDEAEVDAGNLDAALLYVLNELVSKVDPSRLADGMQKGRLRLFTEAYFPATVKGASFPPFSYVLFMPYTDLVFYQQDIERFVNNVPSSMPEKREMLASVHKQLLKELLGEDIDFSKYTRSGLLKLMQGIKIEGFELPTELDVRITDIEKPSKVSDAQIEELLARYAKVNRILKNALGENVDFEFAYRSKSKKTYFWIPVEDAF